MDVKYETGNSMRKQNHHLNKPVIPSEAEGSRFFGVISNRIVEIPPLPRTGVFGMTNPF